MLNFFIKYLPLVIAKLSIFTKGSPTNPIASPIVQSLPILDLPTIYNSTTPVTTTIFTKLVLVPNILIPIIKQIKK